jgi:hypothetical protein
MKPFFLNLISTLADGANNHRSGNLIFVFGFDFGLNIFASDCFDAPTIDANPSLPLIKWFSLLNNHFVVFFNY